MILLIVIFSFSNKYFFTVSNIFDITRQIAVMAIASAGETIVIISGGIDISIGSIVGLGGITIVALCNAGVPVPISFIIGIFIGALIGGFVASQNFSFFGIKTILLVFIISFVLRFLIMILMNPLLKEVREIQNFNLQKHISEKISFFSHIWQNPLR